MAVAQSVFKHVQNVHQLQQYSSFFSEMIGLPYRCIAVANHSMSSTKQFLAP